MKITKITIDDGTLFEGTLEEFYNSIGGISEEYAKNRGCDRTVIKDIVFLICEISKKVFGPVKISFELDLTNEEIR